MKRAFVNAIAVLILGCGSRGIDPRDAAADGDAATTGDTTPDTSTPQDAGTVNPLPGGLNILAGAPGGPGYRDDSGRSARIGYPVGLVEDGHGLVYFVDQAVNTIRRLELATGAVTTIAGSPGEYGEEDGVGAAARFTQPYGITIDGGYLYVTDWTWSLIRRIEIATGTVTTLAGAVDTSPSHDKDGVGTAARFYTPQGIVADGKGNLFVADTLNRAIRKIVIATAEVTTLAGKLGASPETVDDVGEVARFGEPSALAIDGQWLYVLDFNAVRRVDVGTRAVTTRAAFPLSSQNHSLRGVAVDRSGGVFVTDFLQSTVAKVDFTTGQFNVIAGVAEARGGQDGPAPIGRLSNPSGLAMGGDGALYVSDVSNGAIRRIDVATGSLSTVGGDPPRAGSTDGNGSAARFDGPAGVISDRSGNVFIADRNNATIRRLVPGTGAVVTIAGSPRAQGAEDGAGSAARFSGPVALTLDKAGNLFVADQPAATIRRVVLDGAGVTTFAGTSGMTGTSNGTGTAARFWMPAELAFDGSGSLLLTQAMNFGMRRIDTTTAEVASLPGTVSYATGIAVDGGGNVYVASAYSHTIVRLDPTTGKVTTLAGKDHETGSRDGIGEAARFNAPGALALDGQGHLFIAEPSNHLVRRLTIASGEVTTFAGVAGEAGVKAGPLPGRLNSPSGLTVLPSGELIISDRAENVILVAR